MVGIVVVGVTVFAKVMVELVISNHLTGELLVDYSQLRHKSGGLQYLKYISFCYIKSAFLNCQLASMLVASLPALKLADREVHSLKLRRTEHPSDLLWRYLTAALTYLTSFYDLYLSNYSLQRLSAIQPSQLSLSKLCVYILLTEGDDGSLSKEECMFL